MLDLMQILDVTCQDVLPIFKLLKAILKLIQIIIPAALILMGSIDLGKAVMSSDDKEIKGATSKLIKRAIAAVAIFLIPFLVSLLMNLFGSAELPDNVNTDNQTWSDCWSNAGN